MPAIFHLVSRGSNFCVKPVQTPVVDNEPGGMPGAILLDRNRCRRTAASPGRAHPSRASPGPGQAQPTGQRAVSAHAREPAPATDVLHGAVPRSPAGRRRTAAAFPRPLRRAHLRRLPRTGLPARPAQRQRAGKHPRRRVLPAARQPAGQRPGTAELHQLQLQPRGAGHQRQGRQCRCPTGCA